MSNFGNVYSSPVSRILEIYVAKTRKRMLGKDIFSNKVKRKNLDRTFGRQEMGESNFNVRVTISDI